MNTRQPANIPIALCTTRRQFDRWRSRHRKRARLPKELWRQTAALARVCREALGSDPFSRPR